MTTKVLKPRATDRDDEVSSENDAWLVIRPGPVTVLFLILAVKLRPLALMAPAAKSVTRLPVTLTVTTLFELLRSMP